MQANQLSLVFSPLRPTPAHGDLGQALTIDEQFARFHQRNPHIYANLRTMALAAQRKGQTFGIKALFEILRWQYGQATQGEPFKLNNNYTALYARLLMDREPALAGYFATRQRTSKVTRQAVLESKVPA